MPSAPRNVCCLTPSTASLMPGLPNRELFLDRLAIAAARNA